MKTLDKIIKGGKKARKGIALGVATLGALTLIGCGSPSGGSGGGGTNPPVINPPVVENTAPVFLADNCPTVVYENTSGECQLNATGTSPITYSVNSAGAIVVDPNTGKVNWNASEVPQDTIFNYTAKACNDVGCTEETREITVKNVEGNVLPVIQGLALSGTASADANNIYQTWGKDIEGSIVATDANLDTILYDMDASGDGINSQSINGNEFLIGTISQSSTDATADLGQAVMQACDDEGCSTKQLNVVGKNPMQNEANLYFNENGTYGMVNKFTSDGSFLKKSELYVNDVHKPSADITFATGHYQVEVNYSPITIEDREMVTESRGFNEDDDQLNTVIKFTPSSKQDLLDAIDDELDARGISYQENIYASVCTPTYGTYVERYFQKDGKNHYISVADFSNPGDVTSVKTDSSNFECTQDLDDRSQFFIGNPVSSVPKIMEDYLGAVE